MIKKYSLEEVKRKSRFTWRGIPGKDMFSCPKRHYEYAKHANNELVQYVEEAIKQTQESNQLESFSEWQELLCGVYFGKGFAEGLLEMKEKTYKNRYRPLQELESVTRDFNRAFVDLTSEARYPENHLKVGRGFGRLGLVKEGKNMLDGRDYWGKIGEYLSDKRVAGE